jgi:hypothetical protein
MILILLIFNTLFFGKWVAKNIENLQIFESSFFITNTTKIRDDFLETFYLIVADGEDVEFSAIE